MKANELYDFLYKDCGYNFYIMQSHVESVVSELGFKMKDLDFMWIPSDEKDIEDMPEIIVRYKILKPYIPSSYGHILYWREKDYNKQDGSCSIGNKGSSTELYINKEM